MRILFLNQHATPEQGEMNQYVLDVAERLQRAGHNVALVHGRQTKAHFSGTRYVFEHLRPSSARDEEVQARLNAIVDDFAPDIIQLHGVTNFKLDGWLAMRAPTVRFVHNHQFYCSGLTLTWRRPRRICKRPHSKPCLAFHYVCRCGSRNPALNLIRYRKVTSTLRALKQLQGVQVASRMMRENLLRNGLRPERVTHLPLYTAPPAEANVRVRPIRRMVLHSSGLLRRKGVWLMAKSLDTLPSDVELVFAGGGHLQKPLERYVKSHNLSDRIRITGELTPNQWSQLYSQATLVVMPSMWNEPLGLAGLHAMAHAKPVIAFHSNGIAEWMQDGTTGIAVPFADRKAFVAAVRLALEDPERLSEMAEAGRKAWEEKFQPAHHLEALQEYYSTTSSSSRRP
jgi:glycosyltransferase involved in cell wall biosynthesis